jgi:hypothetical protein
LGPPKKNSGFNSELNSIWWAMTGSNCRPPACKAGALPTELIALDGDPWGTRTPVTAVKGRCLNRLTKGPKWWAYQDSNLGPTGYEPVALPAEL